MKIILELDAEHAALLCGTLEREAEQYPFSPNQRHLFEAVEAALGEGESSFNDYLPLTAVRTAPGEYDIMSSNGRRLWFMEGASLADWVCASVNGYDGALRAMSRQSEQQCGAFKPSTLGVPAPEDRCVKPLDHEGNHTLLAEAAALKAERDNTHSDAIAELDAEVEALCDAWRSDIRSHEDQCPATFSNCVPDDCGCGLTEKREAEMKKIKDLF